MSEDDRDQGPGAGQEPATAKRALPRNVPTLTEVIDPDAPPDSHVAAPPAQAGGSGGLPDAQALLDLLGPDLDRRISEEIGRVLHEQMLGLNGRVQKAVAEVVRDAVAAALARGAYTEDVRKNP
ncbi:MAG: hypothetical protein KA914_05815 [Ottowia sp.]|nr:hypothetical protein [Ottowia sp.]